MCVEDGLTFLRMVSEGLWEQVTLEGSLHDEDANLVNQCKGPEAGGAGALEE